MTYIGHAEAQYSCKRKHGEHGLFPIRRLMLQIYDIFSTGSFSNHSIWRHFLSISVPRQIKYPDYGFLQIGEGENYDRLVLSTSLHLYIHNVARSHSLETL